MTGKGTGESVADDRLAGEDIARELGQLHAKRHDIFIHGTADQWRNHVRRTSELEGAYLERMADIVKDASEKAADAPV